MKNFEQFIKLTESDNKFYKMLGSQLLLVNEETNDFYVIDLSVIDEKTFHRMTANQYRK